MSPLLSLSVSGPWLSLCPHLPPSPRPPPSLAVCSSWTVPGTHLPQGLCSSQHLMPGHSSLASLPTDSACFKSLSKCHLLRETFSHHPVPAANCAFSQRWTMLCPHLPLIHTCCNVTFQLRPLRGGHWNAAEMTHASQLRPCVHLFSPNPASPTRSSLGWPTGK